MMPSDDSTMWAGDSRSYIAEPSPARDDNPTPGETLQRRLLEEATCVRRRYANAMRLLENS